MYANKINELKSYSPLNLDKILEEIRERNEFLIDMIRNIKIPTAPFPEKAPSTPIQPENNDKKIKPRDGGYGKT